MNQHKILTRIDEPLWEKVDDKMKRLNITKGFNKIISCLLEKWVQEKVNIFLELKQANFIKRKARVDLLKETLPKRVKVTPDIFYQIKTDLSNGMRNRDIVFKYSISKVAVYFIKNSQTIGEYHDWCAGKMRKNKLLLK